MVRFHFQGHDVTLNRYGGVRRITGPGRYEDEPADDILRAAVLSHCASLGMKRRPRDSFSDRYDLEPIKAALAAGTLQPPQNFARRSRR